MEEIKRQMALKIKELADHLENEDARRDIRTYLTSYEALGDVLFKSKGSVSAEREKAEKPAENKNDEDANRYIFSRKISGGVLTNAHDAKDTHYVKETVVRSLGLTEGDITDGAHNFKIIKKGDGITEDILTCERAVVQRDKDLGLIVKKFIAGGDEISVDIIEPSGVILLNQKDCEFFNVEVGDVLDVAWYTSKSAYRHPIARIRRTYKDGFTPKVQSVAKMQKNYASYTEKDIMKTMLEKW